MSNAKTVQAIYEAFGRGDVPAILERLAEDVEWEYGAASDGPAWLLPRRGRAGVGQFFAALGALEFQKFAPTAILEGNGVVVALVDVEARVKATGKPVDEPDEAHIWRFDERGRVVRFCHRVDTHKHRLAARA